MLNIIDERRKRHLNSFTNYNLYGRSQKMPDSHHSKNENAERQKCTINLIESQGKNGSSKTAEIASHKPTANLPRERIYSQHLRLPAKDWEERMTP